VEDERPIKLKENKMGENCERQEFSKEVLSLRKDIKRQAQWCKGVVGRAKSEVFTGKSDVGEMIANTMLAYRHLEDASMRLGKVLQAHDGGVSVYDKETTVGCD
jgi:hypothetical protein